MAPSMMNLQFLLPFPSFFERLNNFIMRFYTLTNTHFFIMLHQYIYRGLGRNLFYAYIAIKYGLTHGLIKNI
jgi:hypothetical protein